MKKLLSIVLPALVLMTVSTRAESFETEFESTSLMEREARLVVQLLEHAHYSKKTLSELDIDDLLTRYMEELDYARLFFTQEDHQQILEKFGPQVEFGLFQGDLEPAFKIFSRYKSRSQERLGWVLNRLEEDFDLSTGQAYQPDRRKADWPKNADEALELWEKRIKHEVLQMILNEEQGQNVLEIIGEKYDELSETDDEPDHETIAEILRNAFEEKGKQDAFATIETKIAAEDLSLDELDFEEIHALVNQAMKQHEMTTALERIERRYERMDQSIEEIDAVEIQEMFLTTLTNRFDPHSTFLSADTLEDFGISMRLSLVGIGAVLTTEDGYCVIRELVPGGPADLTNRIQPEDRIVAVAQEDEEPVDVVDMKLRRVVNMIRGEKGTEVTLTIIPADAPDPSVREDVTIVRDEVKLSARQASGKVYDVPLENGETRSLGVIEVPSFYGGNGSGQGGQTPTSTTEDVKELIGKMEDVGIDGLVLDLRRNGGGLLSEAVNLTGLFIDSGPVVRIRDSSGNIRVDPVKEDGVTYDGPLSVLVSKNSASGSEIVAGALQSYQRAVIVGEESTHGKGTVQAVFELGNYLPGARAGDSQIGATKLTVQKFYLPDGESTQHRGVIPDIRIPAFNDFLPIGESELPHALVWDTIDAGDWDEYKENAGVSFPLDKQRLEALVESSRKRQSELEEFQYWKDNMEWFRERQEQKTISLNLQERREQRYRDSEFREKMNATEDSLARSGRFSYREVNLDSVENDEPAYPAERTQPDPRDLDIIDPEDRASAEEETEDRERLDIHLRETLRVLNDLIALRKEHREAVASAG